jgi:outer membrane protein TolC
MNDSRRLQLALILMSGSLVTGCGFFRSELPVAPIDRNELRSVPTLEFQPATRPTTRATTSQPVVSTTQAAEVQLSLAEARAKALRNNLDLASSLLDPGIAGQGLSAEEAAFDASFTTSANYSNLDQPTASRLVGSQLEDMSVTPGLRFPLHTGGDVTLQMPLSRSRSNNEFSQLNPAYESDLAVSVRQPLLRGAGAEYADRRIHIAFYQQEQAELRTKLEATRLIANVDRAFWRLAAARRELEVRVAGFDLANAQLDRARRRVRGAQAAEIEITRAESGVADQLELIIVAENSLKQRQRELKLLMNDPNLSVEVDTIIVPDSLLTTLDIDLDRTSLIGHAIAKRTELMDAELQIIQRSIDVATARNEMLPLVTLDYTYNINGLGETFDDSLSLTREMNYQDHRVGLQVEIPIGNRAARARYRQALLQRLKTLTDRDAQALQIRREVLDAVDQIQTNFQRVQAARQRVTLNRRLYEGEVRQFNQGVRTSTEVLDAQIKLQDAESSLVSAETEYQIAQIDLAFATGTTLGSARIEWTPTMTPKHD